VVFWLVATLALSLFVRALQRAVTPQIALLVMECARRSLPFWRAVALRSHIACLNIFAARVRDPHSPTHAPNADQASNQSGRVASQYSYISLKYQDKLT
jgi:hypothetical protein